MATGQDAYLQLKNDTGGLPEGSEFPLSSNQYHDLRKLRPSDLEKLGFSKDKAETVSAALLLGDLGPLGKCMGLKLSRIDDPEKAD